MSDPPFDDATCPVLTWQEGKRAQAATAAERDSVGCVPISIPELGPGLESDVVESEPRHIGASGGSVRAAESGDGPDAQAHSSRDDGSASVVVIPKQQEEKQQLLRRQRQKQQNREGEEDEEEGERGGREKGEGEKSEGEKEERVGQPSQQSGWQWDASLYCYECNVSYREM